MTPQRRAMQTVFSAAPHPQEKLQRRIDTAQIKVLNPPRRGKKCLVLDIDYTIFDLNSTAGTLPAHAC